MIGIAATAIGGYPIFKEAVENIAKRRMAMELSMTIALRAAFIHVSSGMAFILNSARLLPSRFTNTH